MPTTRFNPESLPSLKGKVYVVTGGNTGCGKHTVIGLAKKGAKVYVGARSEEKALAMISETKASLPDADLHFLKLDLQSFKSVVAAAEELCSRESSLHGLVNNAGIMAVPYAVTEDGFEVQWQTNYMSHWLLTHRLLPLLRATAAGSKPGDVRIVNVTSDGHERFKVEGDIKFTDVNLEKEPSMQRYGQSKLADILHAKKLNELYGPGGSEAQSGQIWAAAVHPGHIHTNLNKQATTLAPPAVLKITAPIMKWVGILDEEHKGALSSLWAVASDGFTADDSGAYVVPYAKVGRPSRAAENAELADRLWKWSAEEFGIRSMLKKQQSM